MSRGVISRAPDGIHYIALSAGFDPHISYFRAALRNGCRVRKRLDLNLIQTTRIETGVPARDDLLLFFKRWITEHDLQKEAIELRFRQGIGAFVLDRILCRQHGEHR